MPNVVTFITLAASSVLGACCLTTYNGGSACCGSGGPQNPNCCRSDIALPLTWFSSVICEKEPLLHIALLYSHPPALTGVVSSFVLAWFRPYSDESGGPHHPANNALGDSLGPVKQKPSNENDLERNQGEVEGFYPPPPYEFSPTPRSSYVLPSIPLRKRDMNKLGLTVITDIPMGSPFVSPRKRWRGRGRDVWEKKQLGAFVKSEEK